ncbi:hypothetical protein Tco_0010437 [Tanacetum coccineum]
MKKDERGWKGKVLTIGLLEDVIGEDDCDDDDCDEEMSLVRMLVDGCTHAYECRDMKRLHLGALGDDAESHWVMGLLGSSFTNVIEYLGEIYSKRVKENKDENDMFFETKKDEREWKGKSMGEDEVPLVDGVLKGCIGALGADS